MKSPPLLPTFRRLPLSVDLRCILPHRWSGPWLVLPQVPVSSSRLLRFRLYGEGPGVFDFAPGQYALLSFPGRSILARPRPFTIVSPPEEGAFLEFCVKDVDPWTGQLKACLAAAWRQGVIPPGVSVGREEGGFGSPPQEGLRCQIAGPFGNFSLRRYGGTGRFVFLAAGIGANPVISMLRSLSRTERDIRALLIWGGRTRDDLWAADELIEMARRFPGLRFVPVLSHDPLWTGEKGRIGREHLERYVPAAFGMAGTSYEWNSASYWICGPASFRRELRSILRGKGIARVALHEERFIV